MAQVVLTVLGRDRPGLARALADLVMGAGGNWLESHLGRLGGRFVGAVLVEIDDERREALERALQALGREDLEVRAAPAGEAAHAPGEDLRFSVVGQDRPGIVKQVTEALIGLHVNIEELTSRLEIGAHSGARLFIADVRLRLPPGVDAERVKDVLEDISGEIMVDLKIEA
jgi:glycine cleavage system regulatory protein